MKIKKQAGQELSPRLKEVLDLVHAKRPLIEYDAVKVNSTFEITSVSAWQDGQYVGGIDVNYRRYSPQSGETTTWFAVSSDNIKKRRGNRDTKFCKNAAVAARTAIETFTKKTLAELGQKLINNVKSSLESIHEKVHYDYRSALSYHTTELADYFLAVHQGETPAIPKRITEQIVSKDMLRRKDNISIADNVMRHFTAGNGYCIKVMQDEALLCAHVGDPSTTSRHASTYELDQYTQEKLTMLKLLDANQFAADIGMKYERDNGSNKDLYYFVVAGETKTY